MKRALLMLVVVAVAAGLTGCVQSQTACQPCGPGMTCSMPGSCAVAPGGCQPCAGMAGGMVGSGYDPEAMGMFNPGPPSGAVTYPYYTVRGPRDFLAAEPRPIGP